MQKLIKIVLFSFLSLSWCAGFSEGYSIKVTINGLSNDSLFLAYHFSDKKYIVDTALINESGTALFEGDKKLAGGIYLTVLPGQEYFELIISDDQIFSLEANKDDYVSSMKVKGSMENELFSDYHRFMLLNNIQMLDIKERINTNSGNQDSLSYLENTLARLKELVPEYQKNIVETHPETAFARILKVMLQIKIPDPPKDDAGNILDSLFAYHYYKDHYFDNFDYTDSILLRTPFYNIKIDYYFEKLVYSTVDSIIKEVDMLLDNSLESPMVSRNLTGHLSYYFETSKIMGMEEVFVHIAEKYYLSGIVPSDSAFINKLHPRIESLKPNLIGNTAPDLKLIAPSGEFFRLHQVDAEFTIIVFWEPKCGHCKKEIPKLKKVHDAIKHENIKVFAVNINTDTTLWIDFINEHHLDWINVYDPYSQSGLDKKYDIYSTPVIYILDSDKKIIYKRIAVNNVIPAIYEILEKQAEGETILSKLKLEDATHK